MSVVEPTFESLILDMIKTLGEKLSETQNKVLILEEEIASIKENNLVHIELVTDSV